MSEVRITASMLYDLVACEHRPWMDLFEDATKRDPVSPFVDLLWRRGRVREQEVIAGVDALNLRNVPVAERERETLKAMAIRTPLIYGGRISAGELLGEPDLLRFEDGTYIPGDIKAGAAEEGPSEEDKKPKKHYAVQLALYVDVLERLALSDGERRAFVWDGHGEEVIYDLTARKGERTTETLWDDYQESLRVMRQIIDGTRNPGPAYHGECKHCVWYGTCMNELERRDDLTLLPGLGRSKRDALLPYVRSTNEFAAFDIGRLLDDAGKSLVAGIGPEWIARFHERARLKSSGSDPYLRSAIRLPKSPVELFFDIETDPMQDHCYLHGFIERQNRDNASERYTGFFSTEPTPYAERVAFAEAWDYVQHKQPCTLYIFSKYERTWWRALQIKYPEVCSRSDVDELFKPPNTIDLYQVVSSSTEWPTQDHTIKTLARFLGFSWRDRHPSGAASIEWHDRYLRGEAEAKTQILEYNEDDCRAARILLDGIWSLNVQT